MLLPLHIGKPGNFGCFPLRCLYILLRAVNAQEKVMDLPLISSPLAQRREDVAFGMAVVFQPFV